MGLKSGKYNVDQENSKKNEHKTSLSSSSKFAESTSSHKSKRGASLPTLIHQDVLPDTLSSNTDNLTLIWLDTDINDRPSNTDTQIKLKNIIHNFRIFDKIAACEQYIEQIGNMNNIDKTNENKLLVIISTALALTVIPHLHGLVHVKYIYIFGKEKIDTKVSQELLDKYTKVKGIFHTSQPLIAQIIQDNS